MTKAAGRYVTAEKPSLKLYNNVVTLSVHACKYIYIPKCMIFHC